MKRNNFNSNDVSVADINQRLVKIASAVDDAFAQLELWDEEVTPTTVRKELKRLLNEEKSTRLTGLHVYQLLINERENELKASPATALLTKGTLTKHKTMLRHLGEFKATLYFEDVNDDLLARFELFLINKGLSNNYCYKAMKDIKTFFNWATKRDYNKNMTYQSIFTEVPR